ncbi:MAG: histidine kinase [Bacteroidota bacterium]
MDLDQMATLSSEVYVLANDSITPFAYNDLVLQYQDEFVRLEDFYIDSLGTYYGAYYGLGIIKIEKDGTHQVIRDTNTNDGIMLYQVEDYTLYSFTRMLEEQYLPQGTIQVSSFQDDTLFSLYTKQLPVTDDFLINGFSLGARYQVLNVRDHLLLFKDGHVDTTIPGFSFLNTAAFTPKGEMLLGFSVQTGAYYYPSVAAFKAGKGFHFLAGYSISEIIEDRAGGWWVGTLDDGIFYIAQPEVRVYKEQAGLMSNHVKTITPIDSTHLAIGLRNGAIYQLSDGTPTLSQHTEKRLYDLLYDPVSGRLWRSGITKEGATQISLTKSRDKITMRKEQSFVLGARKLKKSMDGKTIYGCNNGFKGFFTVEEQKEQYYFANVPNSSGWTTAIQDDFDGNLWIGRNDGLYQYANEQLQFMDLGYPNPQTRVEAIHLLADSTLVIGTKGEGIIFWKAGQYTQLKKEHGLAANEVEVIQVAGQDRIWVGTLEGISKVQCSNDTLFDVVSFNNRHGLISNEVNDIVELGNQLWVATTQGLSRLSKEVAPDSLTFPPIIDEVLVNNERVSDLNDLTHQANNLQISFKSLDYCQNSAITYRYRLNGAPNWQRTSSTSVNLLALNPNAYTFEVQAQNRSGSWSASSQLEFRIGAPFWQHAWFWITVAGVLLSFVFQWINRKNKALQQQLQTDQEMNQLRQQALQAQMNPHFIFNCLNAIQGFIADGDSVSSTRYLSKFSNLIRTVLHISNLPQISLEQELSMLEQYLELEQMRFGGQLRYQFLVDEHLDQLDTYLPPLLVQPIVENSIIHGFSETQADYLIQLKFEQAAEQIKITITDNGSGFPLEPTPFPTKHQPFGLHVIQRRLQLMHSAYTMETTNRTTPSGKIKGAQVTLSFEPILIP